MHYIIALIAWYCLMLWARKKFFSEPATPEPENIDLHECMSCGHVQVYNNIYCSECGSEKLALIDDNYHININ